MTDEETLLNTLSDGTILTRHEETGFILIRRGDFLLSVFNEDNPLRLAKCYTAQLADLCAVGIALGTSSSVLHFGGAGMTVARALASWNSEVRQTVVDIDRELVEAVIKVSPLPSAVDIIFGDALNHLDLARTHSNIIIDVGTTCMDKGFTDLNLTLLEGVLESTDANRTIMFNVLNDPNSEHDTVTPVYAAMSAIGNPKAWKIVRDPEHPYTTVLAVSPNPQINDVWEGIEWSGWERTH